MSLSTFNNIEKQKSRRKSVESSLAAMNMAMAESMRKLGELDDAAAATPPTPPSLSASSSRDDLANSSGTLGGGGGGGGGATPGSAASSGRSLNSSGGGGGGGGGGTGSGSNNSASNSGKSLNSASSATSSSSTQPSSPIDRRSVMAQVSSSNTAKRRQPPSSAFSASTPALLSTATDAEIRESQRQIRVSARRLLASDDPVRLIRHRGIDKPGPLLARRASEADRRRESMRRRSCDSIDIDGEFSLGGGANSSDRSLPMQLGAVGENSCTSSSFHDSLMPEGAIDIARSFLWTDEDDMTLRSGTVEGIQQEAGGSSDPPLPGQIIGGRKKQRGGGGGGGNNQSSSARSAREIATEAATEGDEAGAGRFGMFAKARADASASVRNLKKRLTTNLHGQDFVMDGGVLVPASTFYADQESNLTTSTMSSVVDRTGTVWTTFVDTVKGTVGAVRDRTVAAARRSDCSSDDRSLGGLSAYSISAGPSLGRRGRNNRGSSINWNLNIAPGGGGDDDGNDSSSSMSYDPAHSREHVDRWAAYQDSTDRVRKRGELMWNTLRSKCDDVLDTLDREDRVDVFCTRKKVLLIAAVAVVALSLGVAATVGRQPTAAGGGDGMGVAIGGSGGGGGDVGGGVVPGLAGGANSTNSSTVDLLAVAEDDETGEEVETNRLDAIASKILEAGVSTATSLERQEQDDEGGDSAPPHTPQLAALEWIANEDGAQMDVDDPSLLRRYALAVLYYSTGGSGGGWDDPTTTTKTASPNWMTEKGICSWGGIECPPRIGYEDTRGDSTAYDDNDVVTVIDLRGVGLAGTIPGEIFVALADGLQVLDLGGNAVGGTISESIGSLKRLEILHFDANEMSGTIPTTIGRLDRLVELQVQKNSLSGPIPSEISGLSKLRLAYLDSNDLTGHIPPSLGSGLGNLQELFLYSNSIAGTLPKSIFGLAELRELLLNDNRLTGTLPRNVGNLDKITSLYLEMNELSGTVPHEIGYLPELQILRLYSNKFTGEVPQSVCDLFGNGLLWVAADCGGETPRIECDCCQECHRGT